MSDQPTPQPPAIPTGGGASAPKPPVKERAKQTVGTGYRVVRWIVLLVLVVIATIFIIRNLEKVQVDWVFRTSEVPLALVMLGFLLIGLVIGWLIHWFSMRSQRRR